MPATPEGSPTRPPEAGRRLWRTAVRLGWQVLTLAVVAIVAVRALPEIRDAMSILGEAVPALLVVSVVAMGGAVLTLPQVYRAALHAVDRTLPYPQALAMSMSAFMLGRVLPGGGLAGSLFAVRRMTTLGIDGTAAIAAAGIQGAGQAASLGLLTAVVSARAALAGDVDGPILGVVAVVAAAVAVLPTTLSRLLRRQRLRRGIRRQAARVLAVDRVDRLDGWLGEFARMPLDPRRLAATGAWASLNWLMELGALWAALHALGGDVRIGVLMVGFTVANALMGLPHLPGGLGVVEAGMAGTFVALGVDAPLAIGTVLLYRVVAYWLPVVAGLVVWLATRGGDAATGSTAAGVAADGRSR